MDAAGEAHHAFGVEAALEAVQVPEVPLQAVPDVVGQAALVVGAGLEDAVRGEPRDEMLAQIGGEIVVALIAQGLHRAHDRRGIDAVAARQGPRGKEEGLVRVLEGGLQQPPPVWRQPTLVARDPLLDRRASRNAGSPFLSLANQAGGAEDDLRFRRDSQDPRCERPVGSALEIDGPGAKRQDFVASSLMNSSCRCCISCGARSSLCVAMLQA